MKTEIISQFQALLKQNLCVCCFRPMPKADDVICDDCAIRLAEQYDQPAAWQEAQGKELKPVWYEMTEAESKIDFHLFWDWTKAMLK